MQIRTKRLECRKIRTWPGCARAPQFFGPRCYCSCANSQKVSVWCRAISSTLYMHFDHPPLFVSTSKSIHSVYCCSKDCTLVRYDWCRSMIHVRRYVYTCICRRDVQSWIFSYTPSALRPIRITARTGCLGKSAIIVRVEK